MNTSDAAARLETTPRVLRRFLRSDSTYRNAGSGGRYDFDETDLPTLRKRFDAWVSGKPAVSSGGSPRVGRQRTQSNDNGVSADTIPTHMIRSRDPKTRAAIRAAAEARVDRLEKQLMAAGVHISQGRND